jgi:uncharacterized LabA/DUF88 family protein
MDMGNFLYVDNSNIWIEGMRVSAVEKGMTPDLWTAINEKICDYDWKLDFGKLHAIAGGDDIVLAKLYGSKPTYNDTLWTMAEVSGFKVKTFERNASNKEKKIDSEIICEIQDDSYEIINKEKDIITIVAGDGDYVPLVERLVRKRGFIVNVVFWNHASKELKDEASNFISLNQHLRELKL